MITEEDREKKEKDLVSENIQIAQEMLQKSEKYERLKGNPDWEGVKEDIKIVCDIHRREIKYATEMLPRLSFFKRMKTVDFITEHQIRLEQLEEALQEERRILEAGRLARETLPLLRERLISMNGKVEEPINA